MNKLLHTFRSMRRITQVSAVFGIVLSLFVTQLVFAQFDLGTGTGTVIDGPGTGTLPGDTGTGSGTGGTGTLPGDLGTGSGTGGTGTLPGVNCGDTILVDTILLQPLACNGVGLTVSANATLNLNSNTISSTSGTDKGIVISGDNATVTNGSVTGFAIGVQASSTAATITSVTATGNTVGISIEDTATGTTVSSNTISDGDKGIAVANSNDNTISANTTSGQASAGIEVSGSGSTGNTIDGNVMNSSPIGLSFTDGANTNSGSANTFNATTTSVAADSTTSKILITDNLGDSAQSVDNNGMDNYFGSSTGLCDRVITEADDEDPATPGVQVTITEDATCTTSGLIVNVNPTVAASVDITGTGTTKPVITNGATGVSNTAIIVATTSAPATISNIELLGWTTGVEANANGTTVTGVTFSNIQDSGAGVNLNGSDNSVDGNEFTASEKAGSAVTDNGANNTIANNNVNGSFTTAIVLSNTSEGTTVDANTIDFSTTTDGGTASTAIVVNYDAVAKATPPTLTNNTTVLSDNDTGIAIASSSTNTIIEGTTVNLGSTPTAAIVDAGTSTQIINTTMVGGVTGVYVTGMQLLGDNATVSGSTLTGTTAVSIEGDASGTTIVNTTITDSTTGIYQGPLTSNTTVAGMIYTNVTTQESTNALSATDQAAGFVVTAVGNNLVIVDSQNNPKIVIPDGAIAPIIDQINFSGSNINTLPGTIGTETNVGKTEIHGIVRADNAPIVKDIIIDANLGANAVRVLNDNTSAVVSGVIDAANPAEGLVVVDGAPTNVNGASITAVSETIGTKNVIRVSGLSNSLGHEFPDQDLDGVSNELDVCANTPAGELADATGCSASQQVSDDADSDGIADADDVCPTVAGRADYAGCPVSILVNIAQHDVNIGRGKPKKLHLPAVEIKVFDRKDTVFLAVAGNRTPKESLYGAIFESNAGFVATCTTSADGTCSAFAPSIGEYLVIGRYADASSRTHPVYVGKPLSSRAFVDTDNDGIGDLATRNLQIMKISKKDEYKEHRGGKKVVVKESKNEPEDEEGPEKLDRSNFDDDFRSQSLPVGTEPTLEVIVPESAVWEGTTSVYPFIFTSNSDWDVNVCAEVPGGYQIAGVYNDNGDLIPDTGCLQTFVSDQTITVAFEVVDIGSPEPELNSILTFASPKGKKTVRKHSASDVRKPRHDKDVREAKVKVKADKQEKVKKEKAEKAKKETEKKKKEQKKRKASLSASLQSSLLQSEVLEAELGSDREIVLTKNAAATNSDTAAVLVITAIIVAAAAALSTTVTKSMKK